MAKKKKDPRSDAPELDEDLEESQTPARDADLTEEDGVRDALLDAFKDIDKGFEEQFDRSDDAMDYWEIYNCELGQNQFYDGNSKIFMPIVYNAINARKTRFVNQMFPQSGRYVEVTTEDGTLPQAEMALAEHYVRRAKLRTQIMPALVRNGDVEGQYTIGVSWAKHTRHVVEKVKKPAEIDNMPGVDEIDTIVEHPMVSGHPIVEVIADSDFLVLPAVSDSLMDALEQGGSVTILRHWTKAKIKKMIASGDILEEPGELLLDELGKVESGTQKPDKAKELVHTAGIRGGRMKHADVYESWMMLTVDDERRLCRAFYGGNDNILGCKRNPYWCDLLPYFSAPVEKQQGAFKGISKVKQVAKLQYQANDAVNEGMDSAAYALMPIIMTDPEKNPRIASMILTLAAVWETSPNDTKFAEFPKLWMDALEIVATARTEIFQTLSVNPAQITASGAAKKKPSQAEIANEQQIDILTTADAVTVLEEEILTPMVSFFIELDMQFRDDELLVREYGDMGARAAMQRIEPLQMEHRYQFRWYGVEAARNAQQVQQQIAAMNVLRGIPPNLYSGYKIELGPAIAQLVENTFGPRIAPLIFKDLSQELSIDPEQENPVLKEGIAMPVHALDDHMKHLQAHMAALQEGNDPHGTLRVHIIAHTRALEQQQMQQAQMAQGRPGAPGGAGKGMPGSPRAGGQPGMPRGGQGPAGMIHQDRMQDPQVMPRAQ